MRYRAILLDAFGTILQINASTHPYRRLLKEGIRSGRRPSPGDVNVLMKFNGGLAQAAEHLGIDIHPSRLAEIEEMLEHEVGSIKAFPDSLEAVALLQEHNRLVAVCSNLAYPYGRAVKRLFPTLDAYGFSFELGATKPDPRIYQATCTMVGVKPGDGVGENRVIMVGDSLRCDCHGPRAVGITGIHLDRTKPGSISNLMDFAKLVLHEP